MRVVYVALLGVSGGCAGDADVPVVTLDGEERLEVHQLGPIAAPAVLSDGEPVSVSWTSSTPDVVVVDGARIEAVGPGESHLTTFVKDQPVEWVVIVDLPASVRLSQVPESVDVGEVVMLDVYVEGDASTVTWSSSDESLATVSPLGEVTGVSPGRVYITASAGMSAAMVEIDIVE